MSSIATQLHDNIAAAQGLARLLPDLERFAWLLCERYAEGRIVYTFGNGGSAADAQHFTGELIGHYQRDRGPLPAVTLSTDVSVLTCIANDYDYADVFARQVTALARAGRRCTP